MCIPGCVNFLTEIGNYTWDVDKTGAKLNKPVDDFNHLLDAMRYALEDFVKGLKAGNMNLCRCVFKLFHPLLVQGIFPTIFYIVLN